MTWWVRSKGHGVCRWCGRAFESKWGRSQHENREHKPWSPKFNPSRMGAPP